MGEFLQNMYVWLWAALAILMIIVGIKYRREHQGLLAVLMAVFFQENRVLENGLAKAVDCEP